MSDKLHHPKRNIEDVGTAPFGSDRDVLLASIAISLKRIADAVEGRKPEQAAPNIPEPSPRSDTWRFNGELVWCVDTGDETAVVCPDEDVFVRWAKHQSDPPWVMVSADSATWAVRTWKDSKQTPGSIDIDTITVNGDSYPILLSLPF